MTQLLTARGVTAGFGAQTVLHGVSLDVPAGQVTGIFGLNGAGKSVLLKVIAGVVPTWAGVVRLGGAGIPNPPPGKRGGPGVAQVSPSPPGFGPPPPGQKPRVGA